MVYHVSGLGLQPGGLTVPLSYVYLAFKAAEKGDRDARRFFELSGRVGGGGGLPEAVIVFTSRDVILGKVKARYEDRWFGTRTDSCPRAVARYLSSLLSHLELPRREWPELYFVEVDHTDFEDCFFKAYPTFMALASHEVWVNMVGGSNQINAALLSSGCFTAVPTRYYYVFQEGALLHPDQKMADAVRRVDLSRWCELPFFSLQIGGLMSRISRLLKGGVVNVAQLEGELERMGLGKHYIPKLVSSRLVRVEGSRVLRGWMLDYWDRLVRRIYEDVRDAAGVDVGRLNIAAWRRWAGARGVLWRVSLDDGRVEKCSP